MNNNTISLQSAREKIRELVEKNLAENLNEFEIPENFTDDDNIFQLGISNSLFVMKLLNFVEQEFKLEVDTNELEIENFSSVNNLLGLIARMQKKKI